MNKKLSVFFISDNTELIEFFSLIVFQSIGAMLISIVNTQHAIDEMQSGVKPELIILTLPQEQDGDIQELFDYFEKKDPIPILFTADDNHIHIAQEYIPYNPLCGKVTYNTNEYIIGSTIKRLTKVAERRADQRIKASEKEKNNNQPYMELPMSIFMNSHEFPYDFYLKLSDEKYVKVYKQGDDFEKEDVLKYQGRRVYSVYLKSNDYIEAVSKFTSFMHDRLKVKKLRTDSYIKLTIFSFDKVNQIINKIGLRDEVLELTNQVLEYNEFIFKKNKKLKDLLESTLAGNSFISEHSVALTFITSAIAKYMGWPSVVTAEKLSLAALFHDIALSDDDLAQVEILDDKTIATLTDKQVHEVRNHPQKAVDIISTIQGIPADVEKIIIQHHETAIGTGFPREIEWKRIFSLAAVFIVAEDFVISLYQSGLNNINVEHILIEMEEKYKNKGNFSLAVDALKISMGFKKTQTLKVL